MEHCAEPGRSSEWLSPSLIAKRVFNGQARTRFQGKGPHDHMSNESYYEIAITNRQVVVVIVWLLIGIVALFVGGIYVGQGATGGPTSIAFQARYEDQLDAIDQVQESTKRILEFTETQRANLKREHEALQDMQRERASLGPLLEADRKLVEAIFEQQARRQANSQWAERVLGFGFGIVASVIASFLYAYLTQRNRS